MPTVTTPASPYPLPQWQAEPKTKPPEVEGQPGYEKYDYVNGESLNSIALRISQPGQGVSAAELATLNWGTIDAGEINYYLRDYNGCSKTNATDTAYELTGGDRQPWLWVPRIRPKTHAGKFRTPGKNDIGHVAPTYQQDGHINTLVVPPVYSITLELGDIDALFEEITPATHATEPWKHKRILERLQALGYMYTPLGHSEANGPSYWAAEKAWRYYAAVHEQKRGPDSNRNNASRMQVLRGQRAPALSNAELLAILKAEIQNNVVTRGFPRSGVVFQNSKLPPKDEFGVIRLPGGYCFNAPRLRTSRRWTVTDTTSGPTRAIARAPQAPSDADRRYDFELGDDRFRIEEAFLADNPLIGKIPLIASVQQLLPDGRRIPAAGVAVYFQLVDPAPLDPALAASKDYSAPVLRDTVMDYSKDWRMQDATAGLPGAVKTSIAKTRTPTAPQWTALQNAARDVSNRYPNADQARKQYIDGLPLPPELVSTPPAPTDWTLAEFRYLISEMAKHPPPYEISNAGQKRFMDRLNQQIEQEATSADPTDPQRKNCPDRWGGKRSLPIPGNVFEVTARDGLHTPRPNHRDYGALAVATAATPDGTAHKYAVTARTNDKGFAGVVFTPSRCGGDAYRIRAYVGPETLQFDGTDPEGPVVETGTLVVWRNVRMHRYVQKPTPPTPWSTAVNTSINYAQTGTHFKPGDARFDAMLLSSPVIDVQVLTDDPPEPPYRRTDKMRIDTTVNTRGKRNYRPVGSQFLGFKDLLRRCYCELITDCHGKETMDSNELRDAIEAGIQALDRDWDLPDNLVFRTLFYHDFSSPFMLNQRSFDEYNALIAATGYTPPPLTPPAKQNPPFAPLDAVLGNELVGYFNYLLVDSIGAYFSDGGAYPGLTLVQVPRSETWDARAMNNGTVTTSGYGTPARSAFLSHTRDIYTGDEFCYSATSNAAHELGHCLALAHQEFYPGGDPDHHQPQPNKEFVKPGPDDCPCVQGYFGCYGEWCAKCILALRGWKVKSRNNPSGV